MVAESDVELEYGINLNILECKCFLFEWIEWRKICVLI